jgi:hypothetical protein
MYQKSKGSILQHDFCANFRRCQLDLNYNEHVANGMQGMRGNRRKRSHNMHPHVWSKIAIRNQRNKVQNKTNTHLYAINGQEHFLNYLIRLTNDNVVIVSPGKKMSKTDGSIPVPIPISIHKNSNNKKNKELFHNNNQYNIMNHKNSTR